MSRLRKIVTWLSALTVLAIIAILVFLPAYFDGQMNKVRPHGSYPVSARARALHDRLIIGDWHADPLLWKRDLVQRQTRGHVDIPRLIEGNVALQVFTAVTKSPSGLNYEQNDAETWDDITTLSVAQLWPPRTWTSLFERAVYQAEKLRRFEAASGGQLRIIRSNSDLETLLADRAAGTKVVGGILGIEGAHPLEGDIANLQLLQDEGYRLVGLQHFFDNDLGGSLHGTGGGGLSEFGRAVVEAVEDRGLILDVAHSSQTVVRDVLAMTDMPIVVSHTGIYSYCETPRNLPDALMRAVAEAGGVVGIGFWADVTCDDSLAGIAGAIVAAIDLLGEDAVSLGSDYDGTVTVGFDASEMAALTQALIDTGLSEGQIAKVMGGNMVRVLRARLD